MKNFKRIIATVMTVLTLATASTLALTSCGGGSNQSATTPSLTEEKVRLTTVKTPYCDLQFEEEDKKDMIVNKSEEDGYYVVEFKTKVGKKTVELFDVQFGKGTGDYVGKIKKGEKKYDVYINFYDIETDGFSESQMNQIYAIQENINNVNQSITESPNFVE